MSVLDATALTSDPEGLEFLRDVLGTAAETSDPTRRFPAEAWAPKGLAGMETSMQGFPSDIRREDSLVC